MRANNKLISLVVAGTLVFSLLIAPLFSLVSPVAAAVTWTKYTGQITLDNSERYVADAWVINDGGIYKMWYTHGKTDLSVVQSLNTIKATGAGNIVSDIANLNLTQLLSHLGDLNLTEVTNLLDGTSTVIGYATSSDGKTWTVQNSQVQGLASSGGAWNSVGAPCIIKDGATYRMWYTRVKTDLTQTNLNTILTNLGNTGQRVGAIVDLLDGTSTVIGYATSGDGITWTVQNSQVQGLAGSGSAWNSVGTPSVIKDGTTYKMWYTRAKTDVTQAQLNALPLATFNVNDLLGVLDSTSTVISYATSGDGVTWTVQNSQAIAGSGTAWNSVADPSVVKTDTGTYEMWYTGVKTDLNKTNLQSLLREAANLVNPARNIVNAFISGNLQALLNELSTISITAIKSLLSGTSTVIGYATSGDGVTWAVQNPQDLVGTSNAAWSSVAAPSVVRTGSIYEMWYTEGVSNITLQNLLNLALGQDLPIGYASTGVPVVLQSIKVTPVDPTIVFVSGAAPKLQFVATGINSDGSVEPLTNNVTWSSSVNGTATIQSIGDPNPGLATTVAAGNTTITATFAGKSGSSIFTVLPDTTAPIVTLMSPPDGLIISNTNLIIDGHVDDVNATISIIINGGAPIGMIPDTNGDFSDLFTLNIGSNNILVRAIDVAGNIGVSGTVTVVVDPRKPQITIIEPVEGLLTNNSSLVVKGNMTNAITSTLTLRLNGVLQTVAVVGDAFSANVTLAEGDNIILANAYATGHANEADYLGTSGVRTATLDKTPPRITINSPVSGSVINAVGVEVSGTVDDPGVLAANVTVNAGALQTMSVVDGRFSQNVDLNDGTNIITVTAADKARNTASATVTMKVDRTIPGVRIIVPANNLVTNVASQPVTGNITDLSIREASLYLNGIAQVPKLSVALNGSFATTVTLTAGTNTIEVQATNAASSTGTSGVLKVILDTQAPKLSIGLSDPTDSTIITIASDEALGAVPAVAVASNITTTNVTMTQVGINQWSGVFQPIPAGSYVVTGTGTDKAGNQSTATATFAKQTVTIAANTTATVSTNNTRVEISTNATVTNASVSITTTSKNPSGNVGSPEGAKTGAGIFVEIVVSPELRDSLKQVYIKVNYDPAKLPSGTDESSLKLYLWDTASGTWQAVPGSGVNTVEHYIFGTVTHLSKYGAFGTIGGQPIMWLGTPVIVKPGVTDLTQLITSLGVFLRDVSAKSEDSKVELIIKKDTVGKTVEGQALSQIAIATTTLPTLPANSRAVSLAYDVGPNGATFNPEITITVKYDPALIPTGAAEKNLVIAWYDNAKGNWTNLASTVDTVGHTISAKISHFTTFTVLAYTRPAAFTASGLNISPTEVNVGQSVTISATIKNTGDLSGTYKVTLKINDVAVETKDVTLAGGSSQTVTFTTSKDTAGTYTVSVDGLSGTFTVKTVITPKPAAFTASGLSISPTEVNVGQSVTISATIKNTGDLSGTYKVTLKINDVAVETKDVTLAGGSSQTVTFTTSKDTAGTYTVSVDGLSGTFTVKTVTPKPTNWWPWIIGGIIAGIIVIGVIVWLGIRRRNA